MIGKDENTEKTLANKNTTPETLIIKVTLGAQKQMNLTLQRITCISFCELRR